MERACTYLSSDTVHIPALFYVFYKFETFSILEIRNLRNREVESLVWWSHSRL